MFDPFGSMNNMLGQFRGFMSNPVQFLVQNKLNIPQQYMNDPNQTIQYLMNTGQISQQQYDWAVKQSNMIQNNPQFMQFINQTPTQR